MGNIKSNFQTKWNYHFFYYQVKSNILYQFFILTDYCILFLAISADQQPQISNQVPQVSNQSPQVSNQSPQVSNQRPQVSDQLPQVSDQLPQVSDQKPQVSDQVPQVSNQRPQPQNQGLTLKPEPECTELFTQAATRATCGSGPDLSRLRFY